MAIVYRAATVLNAVIAWTQHVSERAAGLSVERIGLAVTRIVVGLHRDVHDAPHVAVLGGEEPAGEVFVQ